jgi:methylmalonyl-CoA mutase C-terminal domain/subunit
LPIRRGRERLAPAPALGLPQPRAVAYVQQAPARPRSPCIHRFRKPKFIEMSERKIRVLVAKPGLDGHDRGAKVIAAALRDAGMEVVYTGLHQTPEMVVNAAIQEDVDVVAMSILSGAHMTLFPRVRELLAAEGADHILITGGGIIPEEDMAALEAQGIGRLFGPGTTTGAAVEYIRQWFAENGRDRELVEQ